MNLSLGGDTYETADDCDAANGAQRSAVDQLRAAGIVVVAAAGNDGFIDRLSSPGCLSNTIAVGATRNDDRITGFTNANELLTVFAPGQGIESPANGGGTGTFSGTSMASPHVAGAVAAIREVHPRATPSEIENAITLAGVPILDDRTGLTTPRLDVDGAIDMLATLATPPPSPAPAPVTGSGSAGGAGTTATTAGGGGGGACGLIGIEPFVALAGIHVVRRTRRRRYDLDDAVAPVLGIAAQASGVRITKRRTSVMSSIAKRTPSRPRPLS